jgi:hypothetical protein
MRIQEKRVLSNNLEKLIKQNIGDPLLTECLYSLGIELAMKGSDDFLKYHNLLADFRKKNYTSMDKIPIGEHGELWAKFGYYYFNFKDAEIARKAEITRTMLKDYFNFTWNNHDKAWSLKQTQHDLNIDHFNEMISNKLKAEIK